MNCSNQTEAKAKDPRGETHFGKGWISALTLLGFLIGLPACGPGEGLKGRKAKLMVFAAASLTDVLSEVGQIYEKQSGVDLGFNFAGSNVLAQQIMASQKADVFVSANEEWMDAVEETSRIVAGSRRLLLSNTLAIIAHSSSPWEMVSATDLCRSDFRFLSLGDPEAVPSGRYAKWWLQTLSCDDRTLWETVADRISPAPDVRSVVGQVEAIAGVVGIVYRTDYSVAQDRVKLLHTVSMDDGPPIRYSVASLRKATHAEVAESFLEFLHSGTAGIIFENHGFIVMRD